MASINATTSSGIVATADNTGQLQLQSAGTTVMTITSTGVTTQVGAPAFRATQASGTSISNTTFTKILFDTEDFDTNSNFASSRFTPTVAGYYQVTGIVRFNLSSGNFLAPYIYKNGSSYQGIEGDIQSATNDVSRMVTSLVYCNGTTDYVEFYVYQSSGGSKTTITGSVNTSFTGSMVRSA